METEHTNQHDDMSGRGRPGGTHDRRMRASDADREATALRLRQHYTEGRLDAREYDERIDRCYAAKTLGELDELFTDLPRAAAHNPTPGRPPQHDFRPPWRLAVIVPVIAALVALSILTGAHLIWLAWPLFFLVLGPFGLFGRRCRAGRGW